MLGILCPNVGAVFTTKGLRFSRAGLADFETSAMGLAHVFYADRLESAIDEVFKIDGGRLSIAS
jgi:hypothetical protein